MQLVGPTLCHTAGGDPHMLPMQLVGPTLCHTAGGVLTLYQWQRYFQNIFKALLKHENVVCSESFAIQNLACYLWRGKQKEIAPIGPR
jgi:hypothetical protein